jgi:IMP cyclohydrolase
MNVPVDDFADTLAGNDYPGRGLVLARTVRQGICVVYFMTGRSPASRDRVLVREGDALYARSRSATGFDPLRHYRAVTIGPDCCVIGNGDQVDAVTANLKTLPPAAAVQGIEFEPDPPLRTPRITAVVPREPGPMLIARSRASVLDPERTLVTTVTADDFEPGRGLLTTTYLSWDQEVISTSHPPAEVAVTATDADELLDIVWSALPADLRFAAAVIEPHAPDPLRTLPRG